jgi:hypothetical protein
MIFQIINKNFPSLVRFFAVAFPGGYKFLAVMLITNFSEPSKAISFSEGFFWVLLFLSFSGIPVASMMSSRNESLSNWQKYSTVLVSTLLCLFFSLVFFIEKVDAVFLINISLAAVFVSIYEFIRKDFFNDEKFLDVFITGAISIILLLALFFCFNSFSNYILALSMLSMLLPAWIWHAIRLPKITVSSNVTVRRQLSVFSQYVLSNAFSTSLASVLPLLLIAELGANHSVVMAQVVALSKVLLLVPKAMAASNIPKLRKNGPLWNIVKPYCRVLNIYFLSLVVLCAPIAWFYDSENTIVFYLLLLSIQISQLALPYSNVLAVEGKSGELLYANIKGTCIFVLALLPIYVFFTQGLERGLLILFVYLIHNLFKFTFTRAVSVPLIK